jgi:hypothetical protein
MPKAKSPRTTKSKAVKQIVEASAPENGNGNGHALQYFPADLEAEIRLRAYELYEQRGYTNGRSEEDWLIAEREVLSRHADQKQTA